MNVEAGPEHAELIRHLGRSTGLPADVLGNVVDEMLAYFGESAEEFVSRRHRELRNRAIANVEVWPLLQREMRQHRFVVGLSERQLRRLVYG